MDNIICKLKLNCKIYTVEKDGERFFLFIRSENEDRNYNPYCDGSEEISFNVALAFCEMKERLVSK